MTYPLSKLENYKAQPHFGVLIEETEQVYDEPYDRHDTGGYRSINVIKYIQMGSKEELEGWLIEAHAKRLKYRVIWADPVNAVLQAHVTVNITRPDQPALQRQGANESFSAGRCPERRKPGGCQLHNLQCGFPQCDN